MGSVGADAEDAARRCHKEPRLAAAEELPPKAAARRGAETHGAGATIAVVTEDRDHRLSVGRGGRGGAATGESWSACIGVWVSASYGISPILCLRTPEAPKK